MNTGTTSLAPMRVSRPLVACRYAQAEALNRSLAQGFASLGDDDFKRRSHFIDGRFENLYLDLDQLPGVAEILAFARAQSQALLRSGQATWIEGPIDLDQPLRSGFWINAMQPGQSTSRHSHEECDELLSGVYYITAPAAAGDILFQDPPFETRIRPEPGLMLLFPPSLEHSVETNRSAEQRLSIAFNIGPELR